MHTERRELRLTSVIAVQKKPTSIPLRRGRCSDNGSAGEVDVMPMVCWRGGCSDNGSTGEADVMSMVCW